MELKLTFDPAPIEGFLDDLAETLAALEQVPEFPKSEFLRLLECLLPQFSVDALCSTSGAGHDRIVLRVGGVLEVFAAALAALQRNLTHRDSPSRG
ncbi:hypothetical protein D9M69_499040 [compost metagenome]